MRERDFQKWVTDVATRFGWKWWHVPSPMRAARGGGFVGAKEAAGLCDLVMTHHDPPRLVFAELKGTGGKLTDEQREFLTSVRAVARISFADEHRIGEPPEPSTIGVYAWSPGMEQAIEDLLRTRVVS